MSLLVTPGCRKATTRTASTCNSSGAGAGRQEQSTASTTQEGEYVRPVLAGMVLLRLICHTLILRDDRDPDVAIHRNLTLPPGAEGGSRRPRRRSVPCRRKGPRIWASDKTSSPKGTSPTVSMAAPRWWLQ